MKIDMRNFFGGKAHSEPRCLVFYRRELDSISSNSPARVYGASSRILVPIGFLEGDGPSEVSLGRTVLDLCGSINAILVSDDQLLAFPVNNGTYNRGDIAFNAEEVYRLHALIGIHS